MKNAFVCQTPYHIMLSIHTAQTIYQNHNNDIYIEDTFSGAFEVYQKIQDLAIFSNIYYIKTKEMLTSKFGRMKIGLKFIRRNFDGLDQKKGDYEQISIFSMGSLFTRLMVGLVKDNGGSIVMLEEGIGSYSNTLINGRPIHRLLEFLTSFTNTTYYHSSSLGISKYYYFQPELVDIGVDKKLKFKIPNILGNAQLKNTLNYVFAYAPNTTLSSVKFLYFDQPLRLDGIKFAVTEEEIVKILLDSLATEKLCIKIHPRDQINKYLHLNLPRENILNSPHFWELIYLNEALEDKILISTASSALFTPSIVFGKVHTIVLLDQVAGIEIRNFGEFIQRFKEQINTEVFTPKNAEELKKILKQLNSITKDQKGRDYSAKNDKETSNLE